MKRVGYLTEQIADIDNLYLAFNKASRGKHGKKEVKLFLSDFDNNIGKLRESILSGNVDVGHYHYFKIMDPKERQICATTFTERVLHHAIMNVCHPYFDRSLIDDTYATRKGKGVYAALDKAARAAGRYGYLLKLDFRKYYDSVDHGVLKQQLLRKFKDKRLLNIFFSIIDSYHVDAGKGLPIGNLTSQYFANLYLSELDHKVKERWGAHIYIRYMDDILIAGESVDELKTIVGQMSLYSKQDLCLTFKPPVIARSSRGVTFLGYRILPYHYLLAGRSKRRFRTKLISYNRKLEKREWTEQQYQEHILPILAFVKHAESTKFLMSCIEITGGNREWV